MQQLTPSELQVLEPGDSERLQAAAAEVLVASMEAPLNGGDGDSSALANCCLLMRLIRWKLPVLSWKWSGCGRCCLMT